MTRIADVGPIVRYILSQRMCSHRLDQRTATIRKIKKNPLLLKDYLDIDGMKSAQLVAPGDEFFPETIFITTGTRCEFNAKGFDDSATKFLGQHSDHKEDDNRKYAVRTFTNLNDAGSKQMVGLSIISEFDLDQDYEGQDIEYEKLKIIPVCKKTLAELLAKCRKVMLSYFRQITAGDSVKFGETFEKIALHDLCLPYKVEMKEKNP
jgi:hypothetical protein